MVILAYYFYGNNYFIELIVTIELCEEMTRMKVVVFRAGKEKKKKSDNSIKKFINFGFEKILFFTFVCLFIALVFVQGTLLNPSLRGRLVKDEGVNGRPIGSEEYLYNEGEISIALLASESNEDLKLLVNGDEVAVFNQNLITISVKDGDVVEIDASSTDYEAELEIISASENISGVEVGKKIKVQSNIEEITRVSIDE